MRGRAEALGWWRLRSRGAAVAVVLSILAAAAEALSARVAGRIVVAPSWSLLAPFALLLMGAAALDITGRSVISGVIGRAEGRLRADLLEAALAQPLTVMADQAVGELIDRVDDDPAQAADLLRGTGWIAFRGILRAVAAWVVAGLTWWPAWFVFPVAVVVALRVARTPAGVVARRKVSEEEAWSDHAAQLEEAVAGRDDVRSALGQPHVLRRYAERAQVVLGRVGATANASATVTWRSGVTLQALLAGLAVGGVALVGAGRLSVGALVTMWLLTTTFLGELLHLTTEVPELQQGLGALTRIRTLLTAPAEIRHGRPLPPGPADVELRQLSVGYPDDGIPVLSEVTLRVPAGTSCALVGRTGSGKSTLARCLSRALEPPPGTVLVAGQDVTATELAELRRAVGVVTQRTEILSATLAENVTLFAPVPLAVVEQAFAALELESWVASLPDGLDTVLGADGTTLSAGEEQLVAFARLLVRDVRVVVLDEATARMDPQTEQRVSRAADLLLAGRTGIVVAHRLSTTRRCDHVAVLEAGRLVQHGPREQLAASPGPFAELLRAAGTLPPAPAAAAVPLSRRTVRRELPAAPVPRPSLARTVARLLWLNPRWGFLGACLFATMSAIGTTGALTGWLWGRVVTGLDHGSALWWQALCLAAGLLLAPFCVGAAFRIYPLWWVECTLRLRLAVLRGQTMQHRLHPTPPGEVTARALDSERLVLYADRWVDVTIGAIVVGSATLLSRTLLVGAVLGGVLLLSAVTAVLGAPLAASAAREAGDRRAQFGRSLGSTLDAVRTVKLAAAEPPVRQHLRDVDARRIEASIREHRVRALVTGTPLVLTATAIGLAWAAELAGVWGLGTALLVATTVSGFGWFGEVSGAAVTEAPVARRWLQAASELAGRADLVTLPEGVSLVRGSAPRPVTVPSEPLLRLRLTDLVAVHGDGTVGVEGVDLAVPAGALVLVAGRVGSGKSSLLSSLAGLVHHEGSIHWNDREVDDPQLFLRPGQVAYVGQVPRVLSGTFSDNVALDHDARDVADALTGARLDRDVCEAGGPLAVVGHRGVRLSGGQVQRLALARALATGAELLIADDVSSALDARTEVELWESLRERGVTVVGSSSKRSALERADAVVVLEDGRLAEIGPWSDLASRWGHLAG